MQLKFAKYLSQYFTKMVDDESNKQATGEV